MAQNATTPSEERRRMSHTVDEGDIVFMGVRWHGSLHDEIEQAVYDSDIYEGGVVGKLTKVPRESTMERIEEDGAMAVMADFTVETADGETFTWNTDNGYVLGHDPRRDMHSDIGKFGGFYEPTEEQREEFED